MYAECYACQIDDHSLRIVDDSDFGAVVLADIHFKRGGDRPIWFDKICVAKRKFTLGVGRVVSLSVFGWDGPPAQFGRLRVSRWPRAECQGTSTLAHTRITSL